MTEIDSTPETVRRLVELVAENGLTELTVEEGGVRITVKAVPEMAPGQPVVYAPGPSPVSAPAAASRPPAAPRATHLVALESPMVGVFYRSPSPDDPPFVNVGDIIRVGQPIGLIEAMKVYSEVPAEAGGRVMDIPVASGQLVQQGQPLIYIEPL